MSGKTESVNSGKKRAIYQSLSSKPLAGDDLFKMSQKKKEVLSLRQPFIRNQKLYSQSFNMGTDAKKVKVVELRDKPHHLMSTK